MKDAMKIPLSRPDVTALERKYVQEVLNTPDLSLGPLLPKFESVFAEYIGTKHAVAVNSGTSGLHVAVKAAGIKEGDAVITTPFSFIASANCILFERARPVFVDIDPVTYNMDTGRIEDAIAGLKRRGAGGARAVLPVHVFGRPCEMEPLMEVAGRHGLPVIEDACEALGATYRGRKAGAFGKAGVFAFYPNKQVTTGEGGMVVTDDDEIARHCRSLRNQGRGEDGAWLSHERLGYNYRLSDINCALGLAQMERIEDILARRSGVARMYGERLRDVEQIHPPAGQEGMSWFVYVVRLADRYSRDDRDGILQGLRAAGIGCNNYFSPIHLQPFYRELFGFKKGDFPVTEHVSERTIALPFYNDLREEQIDYTIETLKGLL